MLLALLLGALLSLGARTGIAGGAEPARPPLQPRAVTVTAPAARNQAGPNDLLTVQYTFPAQDDVEVDTQATVMVQFNRPVAALTAIAQRPSIPVLAFDPPVGGTGRWLTSALYTFKPSPGFQAGTRYHAQVLTNLSDLPGGTLAAPYDFYFTTIVPAVADMSPRDNTKFVDPMTGV